MTSTLSMSQEILEKRSDDSEDSVDIIELNDMNLSDDESWLSTADKSSETNNIDVYQWLRKDLDDIKDSRYQTHQLLLQSEIDRLETNINSSNSKFSVYFDSRTFTRPRKKVNRPSLESVLKSPLNLRQSSPFSNNLKDSNYDRSSMPSESKRYGIATDEITKQMNHLSEKLKDVHVNRSTSNLLNTNRFDISDRLQDIIREQEKELATSYVARDGYPKSVVNTQALLTKHIHLNLPDRISKTALDSFIENNVDIANMSPPSFISSFTSANFTSLTESDFITAMSQPQDLFTSFTSSATTDLADDQNEVIQLLENESFADDVKQLNATFSKDIYNSLDSNISEHSDGESTGLNNTIVIETHNGLVQKDMTNLNSTITNSPNNYLSSTFRKPPLGLNSGPESLHWHHNEEQNKEIGYKTFKKNTSSKYLNDQTVIIPNHVSNQSLENDSLMLVENKFSLSAGDAPPLEITRNSTFPTGLCGSISQSDPNLLDDCKGSLNDTFTLPKETRGSFVASADNLDKTISISKSNSSSCQSIDGSGNRTFQLRQSSQYSISTPKPSQNSLKTAWTSLETLSPICLSRKCSGPDDFSVSFEDKKSSRSFPNSINASPLKQNSCTSKLHKIPPPMRSLKPPQDIPKPKPATNITVTHTEIRRLIPPKAPGQSFLRQPMVRGSGLPRPTSSSTLVSSSTSRLPTRLPAPRVIRPPSTHLTRPATNKPNWRDGCY